MNGPWRGLSGARSLRCSTSHAEWKIPGGWRLGAHWSAAGAPPPSYAGLGTRPMKTPAKHENGFRRRCAAPSEFRSALRKGTRCLQQSTQRAKGERKAAAIHHALCSFCLLWMVQKNAGHVGLTRCLGVKIVKEKRSRWSRLRLRFFFLGCSFLEICRLTVFSHRELKKRGAGLIMFTFLASFFDALLSTNSGNRIGCRGRDTLHAFCLMF